MEQSQLPLFFLDRMKESMGTGEFEAFRNSYLQNPSPTIRLNPKKQTDLYDDLSLVLWYSQGRYLKENRLFITDPLWHAGTYYVQEPSSMILAEIFRQLYENKSPERALDLCAAPGGKSTLLQSLLHENSVLIANEVIKSRVQILKENHIRWGASSNLIITQNDPKDFAPMQNFFDYIQVDAPCSGEGMFRKGDTALKEWSQANCDLCAQRQRRILGEIVPTLATEGILVYSTCTFNQQENEENIHWASREFGLESLRLDFPESWGITEVEYQGVLGYYFYPHKVKGEGLFISVLKKKEGEPLAHLKPAGKTKEIRLPELSISENIVEQNGTYSLETPELRAALHALPRKLNVVYSGIKLGELKNGKLVPDQALANYYQKLHNFPTLEVTKSQALNFLRGQDPQIQASEKGIHLLTYDGWGLGWIKYLGNRSNNYYPKPWRIKKY